MEQLASAQQRAKRYEAVRIGLFVVETALTGAMLFWFLMSGTSQTLAHWARGVNANPWLHIALYGAVTLVGVKLIFLPLSFLGGFVLEHRFGLSNETLAGWLRDQAKAFGLSLALGVGVLDVLYFLLRRTGNGWWVWAGACFLVFGIVMTVLFPVLILPLFYKLEPLEDDSLKGRLIALAERFGSNVLGVYRMAMSEKTKKANAALAGLGKTKRIILGDTLLDHFAEDEIEVVMAHELAHYKHGDIWRLIAWSAATTLVGLRIADWGLRIGLARFGFEHVWDIGAFPLLALCLFGFGLVVMPVNNAFSRWREWKADEAALELTQNRDGFIRAMRKLGEQNLADLSPHPLIEYLLHDHPSLSRRIAWAQQWRQG